MIGLLVQFVGVVALALLFCFLLIRVFVQKFLKKQQNTVCAGDKFIFSVAFFHPYCNAGGGGERVLWAAIEAIQEKYPDILCVVYTGDIEFSPKQILDRAKDRFNITIRNPVQFKFLRYRRWVEAERYPIFTLLFQSLGSIILGFEALFKFVPDVYIDSMGYAFTLPLFKYLGGCKVGCYVHYPTISTDMLQKVSDQNPAHNNNRLVASSSILTQGKLIYYRLFAFIYGLVGRCSDLICCNSSWTKNHISELWKAEGRVNLVYPPCNVEQFADIPINKEKSDWRVLSIAQFRPEKDHPMQIRAFALFQQQCSRPEENFLVLVGSCRSAEDDARVKKLMELAKQLKVEKQVVFKLNVTFEELKLEMGKASVGIHSMWNEHFGIGVVESMAAGLLMVAHDSGGPKMDIIIDHNDTPTGFLAFDEQTYAEKLHLIKNMPKAKMAEIQENARMAVKKFTDGQFQTQFLTVLESIL